MAGCGLNMQSNYAHLRPQLMAGNYDGAAAYVDSVRESFYDRNSRLLYLMDRGMVLHLAKRFQESNATLEQAKQLAEELWTESIGANAAAWLTTDNALPYQGEDFEKVLLHFVAALNYMGLGDLDDARVEARQVSNALALYNGSYEDKSAYHDDAFSRWLSGRLAETETGAEAKNDAWIDYKKSLSLYEQEYAVRYGTQLPQLVVASALRVLSALGPDFADEFAQLRTRYPQVPYAPTAATPQGQVIFIHLNGEAPIKEDRFWNAVVGTSVLRVAYPVFLARQPAIVYATVTPRSAPTAVVHTEMMENINAIAVQNLADHMGRIQAKSIARAIAKFAAGTALEVVGERERGGVGGALALAGALWNMGNAVAEQADKRSWVTLPANVTAAELWLAPGPQALDVAYHDAGGRVLERTSLTANVRPGETLFLSHRTFR